MAKTTALSGFPEWTPGQRRLEQFLMQGLQKVFESGGFAPLETRSVEPLSVLLSKGDDKEIYVLNRLHDDPKDNNKTKEQLGLHFDLTVPFARYVVEHQHLLNFPFKRYQMQKSWRGERPQEGRFREFYQCDIDLIGSGQLDISADAEMVILLHQAVNSLPIPKIQLCMNNRKALQGFYLGLGVAEDQLSAVLRVVDKILKIGADEVANQLTTDLGLNSLQVEKILALIAIPRGKNTNDALQALEAAKALGVEHELFLEGIQELSTILNLTEGMANILVDFSIARGLDYYTGSVFEGYMIGHEHIGAVCAGGRYDNLASGGRTAYPGVGVSIGLTRILGYLFGRDLLSVSKQTPTQVMVMLNDESSRRQAFKVAYTLRHRGVSTEVYHAPHKFVKQLKAIEKRQIPYALFVEEDGYSVKNLANGEQFPIDIDQWLPDAEYIELAYETNF